MFDIDKWPPLFQWLAGIGIIIGGIAGGLLGRRKGARNVDSENSTYASGQNLRALESLVLEARIRNELRADLKQTEAEFENQIHVLEERLRKVENEGSVIKTRLEGLEHRRAR